MEYMQYLEKYEKVGFNPFARTKQKLNKVLITKLSFFSLKL